MFKASKIQSKILKCLNIHQLIQIQPTITLLKNRVKQQVMQRLNYLTTIEVR